MIYKTELVGKFIRFLDKQGKFRTQRVVKVSGNTLTVVDALKRKSRVHRDAVIGREFRKRGLEKICWEKKIMRTKKVKDVKQLDVEQLKALQKVCSRNAELQREEDDRDYWS
jgi:hypothetical protein